MLQRKFRVPTFLFAFVLILLSACKPVRISTSEILDQKTNKQTESPDPSSFNLKVGTTWTYLDDEYEQAADPVNVETATYRITETVTKITDTGENMIAWVKQEKKLEKASENWLKVVPVTNENVDFLYVIKGSRVYKSIEPIGNQDINKTPLRLIIDLPLFLGKEWCPYTITLDQSPSAPITDCDNSGKRTVTNKVVSQNPIGIDKNCVQLVDQFTSGPFLWQYCDGVGIIEAKYEHHGTKFGYERRLIEYKSSISK